MNAKLQPNEVSGPLWPPEGLNESAGPVAQVTCPGKARLHREFIAPRIPVVIQGLAQQWPAIRDWSTQSFRQNNGHRTVRYIQDPAERPPQVHRKAASRARGTTTIDRFMALMEDPVKPRTYLVKTPVADVAPDLMADLERLRRLVPLPGMMRGLLSSGPYFWMGEKGVASPLHMDWEDNFFLQLDGRKEWLLFPPEARADLYWPCKAHPDGLAHWTPIDITRPDRQRFPRFFGLRPRRHVLEPGEILFVPAGWWHAVGYPEDAVSVNLFWHSPASLVAARHYYLEKWRRRIARLLRRPPPDSEVGESHA